MRRCKYTPKHINSVEIRTGGPILVGSVTELKVQVSKSDVSVESFEDDEEFVDGGFGDITF